MGTYHGLYATHPRNDKRLQTVIHAANQLPLDEYIENPEVPGEFQRRVDGLVWGDSIQGQRAENRFYHNRLAFTFEHPEGWTVQAGSQAIVASAPDGGVSLTLTIRRRDGTRTPQAVLEDSATGSLEAGLDLDQSGLIGYSAIASANGQSVRLAVIDYNSLSYLFQGEAADFPARDGELLAIIQSFRPMHPREQQASTPRYVKYIQVPRGATLESLAAGSVVDDAEARLRLINGFYPRGEPRTGDWIKVIR